MQVLVASLVILALITFIVYKIKKSITKKDIIIFLAVVALIIVGLIYNGKIQEEKLPNVFKENYLKQKNIEILKLSSTQVNFEVLSSTRSIYDFIYIIKKANQEYLCEAKNVEVLLVEDEYVIKEYQEECKLK
ncbi:hypothetical protein [Poseidonibacter ostreae]|jgi:hypothetical protein|uniref:Uncharacterized protein n=1 Tax=Poseidonibacter ostreae TaxID=2654171 RepID=A0A6L4WUF7_9BACT|nr:hypothetical protein [Poseidonibacter ostreae]KAB7885672.1 hypothetical protein GA417_07775 [Poseidonibacter ostreae]KAB7888376.1 hypothetical protein GBG18_13175 [Poseidonibacter ostreae]KAB7889844.1 hypothetical protein GBG19_04665 [Poseidonibacter ostreae]MAC83159.1 hypothetical protein [Arcobacter sp.]|tara:strand:+ start:4604 stop:5002 length:399 start_codon:yes stop_codon:yes gene_type:complete